MAKWVYSFKEGNADMRDLLGGKGANLAEMTNLGLPIPQGFTVTTEACTDYYNNGKQISDEVKDQIFAALAELEKLQNKKFGDTENPLLVSVRSGARASMPGIMDTILNLGLTDISVEGFAKKTGNPRFAYDSYRRFIQMFSDVVMEVPKSLFERVLDEIKEAKSAHYDTDLTADDLKEVITRFKAIYKDKMGEDFPQDPKIQLMEAVKAVFRSWDNERAIVYRRMNDIPGDWGTAVNVQSMVFEIWAILPVPVLHLPGILPQGPGEFTENTSSTRRAKMLWPESGLPSLLPVWNRICPNAIKNLLK